jgi:phospholipid-binding lipoprotein MlaA
MTSQSARSASANVARRIRSWFIARRSAVRSAAATGVAGHALARILRAAALAVATAALAGCAATPSKVDPLEPMNRTLYEVHDVVDTNVVKPIAQVYVAVIPQFVRTGIANVFNNIEDVFSAVNGLLQGKLDKAGNDMGRVLTNTLFGVGGIFDVASEAGIERGNEDFGQTFGYWGFPQGPYLFIPLFGPTTVRDGTGVLVRIAVGPVGFLPDVPVRNSLYGVGYVDLRAQALGTGDLVDTAALDRYLFIRNAYLQRRRYLLNDGKPPPDTEDE